ncbi:transferase [Gottschalkia purinilytica]|uniref:4,4'-diaponeurosporenoate glycosyltransferase n=1 Tax=Gottschalkia purinilytica TaxID=1503 RepID=A0A0L0W707_GOTPU|nr:TIGR04283 family arsenosugar biosynthesis glycosyltransferase [Gottschalkia purinilytica]KNF07257.1 transferase [Gottschalkia purinilytica]
MISIILPLLNEEKSIENTLTQIQRLKGDKEIIVVDGGSTDSTVKIASKYAIVINSEKGRGKQMNAGAKVAKGDILWFIHSDSKLEENSLISIRNCMEEGYCAGGFPIYFYDYDTAFMRFVSVTSNLRAKYLGLYFGDQGIFIKKKLFNKIDGFKEIEIMEDWEFSKRLNKVTKLKMLSTKIGTSGRRFKSGGQLRTLLLMHKIKIMYLLGVSPKTLNSMYREAR